MFIAEVAQSSLDATNEEGELEEQAPKSKNRILMLANTSGGYGSSEAICDLLPMIVFYLCTLLHTQRN